MTEIPDRLKSILKSRSLKTGGNPEILLGVAALIGLCLISYHNYLLFHVLAELFSIVIGLTLFIIAWNLRRTITNHYILFIGIAYLFVAVLDTFHTLSYKGMGGRQTGPGRILLFLPEKKGVIFLEGCGRDPDH